MFQKQNHIITIQQTLCITYTLCMSQQWVFLLLLFFIILFSSSISLVSQKFSSFSLPQSPTHSDSPLVHCKPYSFSPPTKYTTLSFHKSRMWCISLCTYNIQHNGSERGYPACVCVCAPYKRKSTKPGGGGTKTSGGEGDKKRFERKKRRKIN